MGTPSAWEYFSLEELTCHCGCGQMKMQADAMKKFVKLRRFFGGPLIVTSGYRCPEYDAKIGTSGSPGSGPHTEGVALDINIFGDDLDKLMGIVYHELKGIFTGKGIMQVPGTSLNKRLLHLDSLPTGNPIHPRPGLWSYPPFGGG